LGKIKDKTGRFIKNYLSPKIGNIFSRWSVIGDTYKASNSNNRYCLCKCVCGTIRPVLIVELQKGTSSSCGCTRGVRKLRPFESGLNLLIRQATKRKYAVNLTYDEYLEFTKIKNCHYCNNYIDWAPFNMIKNKACGHHLDRKDDSLGYSKENCVVCCPRCNWAKGWYFTYDEWLQLGNVIRTWSKV